MAVSEVRADVCAQFGQDAATSGPPPQARGVAKVERYVNSAYARVGRPDLLKALRGLRQ